MVTMTVTRVIGDDFKVFIGKKEAKKLGFRVGDVVEIEIRKKIP